jgi:RsiW-degrading membrane proteinase PrsW (M82 family)
MMLALTAVSAIVPSVLLAWYFHSRDVHPEPTRVVWATFGLGVLCVIPVLAVALPLSEVLEPLRGSPAAGTADAFITAAIPEELFKFVVLFVYASRHRAFDEPMDGIVYGVIASLGFATLENLLYSLSGGLHIAGLRAVTAVPSHAFWGAIMGYYVGQAKFGDPGARKAMLARALLWPMLLHGLYDTPLLSLKRTAEAGRAPSDEAVLLVIALTIAMVVVSWVWAVKLVRRLRRIQQEYERTGETPPWVIAATAAAAGAMPLAGFPTPAPGLPGPYGGLPAPTAVPGDMEGGAATIPVEGAFLPAPPASPGFAPPPPPVPGYGPIPMMAPLPPPPRSPTPRWAYLLQLVFGAVLATGGGLMTLGLTAAFFQGSVEPGKEGSVVVGGLIVGAAPLALGLWMFVRGLNRMPKRVRVSRLSLAPPARAPLAPPAS